MSIKHWPNLQRPREKLLMAGPKALTDAELLAVILATGTATGSALDLAQNLLHVFGSIRALIEAEGSQVCAVGGIGPAKYARLLAGMELAERSLFEAVVRGDALTDPAATRRYVSCRYRSLDREVFACICLDNQHRVLGLDEVFKGTIDGAAVYPREVVKLVLRHNAAAVIFVHNHPSGVAEPSEADKRLTGRLQSALLLVDVRVLDHLVIGDNEVVSLAERGLL